jgi:hypothetical protein
MELIHDLPEGIEFPDMDKFHRNHMAVLDRVADLIDTHVGQFVACFGDDQQFVYGNDVKEVLAQIPSAERPTAVIEPVPARDEILIL